jgi:hypothetical protein
MEVLVLVLFSLSNIVCFLIGARVGQKVTKGEEVELPSVNPMEVYREHEAKKEAERVKEKIDTIMRNIDNYDGTSYGQEDVPRG